MNDYDYIIDAFSRDGNNTNLEVDNLTVGCITSKNNNFSLHWNVGGHIKIGFDLPLLEKVE